MAARGSTSGWYVAPAGIAAVMLLALGSLAWTAAQGSEGLWLHVARYVLPQAGANTLALLAGVAAIVITLGTACAWLVSAYEFPARRLLAIALVLPLAIPSYIVAFAYLDLLHPLGPLQAMLRTVTGTGAPQAMGWPDPRTLPALIVLMGLVLYPYVYLTARALFVFQAANLIDAARSLGASRRSMFLRVALPLARPAIAIGTALALLEVLGDIGASKFLGVHTLTVAIYDTWTTRSDLPGAAQIACAMLVLVLAAMMLERYGRRRKRFTTRQGPRRLQPQRLSGARAVLATTFCVLPALLGFLVPTAFLLAKAWQRVADSGLSAQLLNVAWDTLRLAALTSLVIVGAGLLVLAAVRLAQSRRRERLATLALRIGTLGYALPGTVMAIALLSPMMWFDTGLAAVSSLFGVEPRIGLMGSMSALVLALALRFLALAAGSIETGLARIPVSLDEAARGLGAQPASMLGRVHLPLLRPALATGALVVFVDVMKELPVTLMLRPIGFESLATLLYAEAARGTYEDGAVAALLIVLVSLVPVALLGRYGFREDRETAGLDPRMAAGAHT